MIERRLGGARAVWTDRHGGVSRPPYDTANLGGAVGDAPAAVAENRRRLAERLELGDPKRWCWLRQPHGATVFVATAAPQIVPEADAAVTTTVGLPLVVLTADCAPIALATDDAVAVVHAGWRGLIAGVVGAAVAGLRAQGRGEVRAVIGPCIGAERYEFARAELQLVVTRFGPGVEARTSSGAPALDVPAAARAALREVSVDAVEDLGVCTATSPDHFSYRRDGVTGRQALVVVRESA